jgi:hypothetical protein
LRARKRPHFARATIKFIKGIDFLRLMVYNKENGQERNKGYEGLVL